MDLIAILNYFLKLVLSLYGDTNLPKNLVMKVIHFFEKFLTLVYLPALKYEILNALDKKNPSAHIDVIFKKFSNIFSQINTENKIMNIFKSRGYIVPKTFRIDSTFIQRTLKNTQFLVPKDIYMSYVPMHQSLAHFLQIPGMFSYVTDYYNYLVRSKSKIKVNIMQGELWKQKYLQECKEKLLFPLYIYYDEIECGNPLGSHAGLHKYEAIYASIACLPPSMSSELSSILFVGLINSNDQKSTSNEKVYRKIINELNFLRAKGIIVKIDKKSYRIYFQCVLVIGDNLGLNEVLGFTTNFKDSIFRRICTAIPEEWKIMTTENVNLSRTRTLYESHVKLSNVQLTGIKENCVFNKVQGFHVVENKSVDVMHDFTEGVCKYVMRAVIYYFVFDKKYFSIDELNSRFASFDYGSIEESNKVPEISLHPTKDRFKLKFSAKEMLVLVRYFGLIINERITDKRDKHWILYKCLRQILDILMSPRIIDEWIFELHHLIFILNSLYLSVSGPLKPKFHYLNHYPALILSNGPLIHFSCFRFESFHRHIRSAALAVSSSKNLLITISTKLSLNMCYMFNEMSDPRKLKKGTIDDSHFDKYKKYSNYVEINGTIYKKGSVVVVDNEQIEKVFGEIVSLYSENEKIVFNLQIFHEISFNFDSHAYIVKKIRGKYVSKNFVELPKMFPCLMTKKSDNYYVASRYRM